MSPQSQKGKPPKKDLPLLKNDITNNLEPQKPAIYSRYRKFRVDDFELKSQLLAG